MGMRLLEPPGQWTEWFFTCDVVYFWRDWYLIDYLKNWREFEQDFQHESSRVDSSLQLSCTMSIEILFIFQVTKKFLNPWQKPLPQHCDSSALPYFCESALDLPCPKFEVEFLHRLMWLVSLWNQLKIKTVLVLTFKVRLNS